MTVEQLKSPDTRRWFNHRRHTNLMRKMRTCGFSRWPTITAAAVAAVEVIGSLMLIVGFGTRYAAAALGLLTIGATICTWREKVYEQCPVDGIDCISCYLWRVEGLYIALAFIVLMSGSGTISLEHILT